MIDKLKCILVILTALISAGYALHCYKCQADMIFECLEGSSKLTEAYCGVEHGPLHQFCILRTVYDNALKKETVEAGCEALRTVGRVGKDLVNAPEEMIVLDQNVDQCQSNGRYNVTNCVVCAKDFCNLPNSARIAQMSLYSLVCLFASCTFAKFMFS